MTVIAIANVQAERRKAERDGERQKRKLFKERKATLRRAEDSLQYAITRAAHAIEQTHDMGINCVYADMSKTQADRYEKFSKRIRSKLILNVLYAAKYYEEKLAELGHDVDALTDLPESGA